MKKILFILALIMPLILSAQPDIINLDELGSTWQSIDIDTLYFSKDSTYITGDGDTIQFVVDSDTVTIMKNTNTDPQLIIDPNLHSSDTRPGLAFGDGNTGFYETADNTVYFTTDGTKRFFMNSTGIGASSSSRLELTFGAAPSATVPVVKPSRIDGNTGIGHAGVDQLSLIAGGVEGIRIAEDGGNISAQINGSNNYAADVQGDDNYEIDIGAITQLTEGLTVTFKANTANTGGVTLEITNVGDLDDILKMNNQALITGDIEAGQIVVCVFDGTNWQMTSQLAQ